MTEGKWIAPIDVELTDREMSVAKDVAEQRMAASVAHNRSPTHGFIGGHDDRLRIHILGARGESAFCKAVGLTWSGSVDSFKNADVGKDIQVRTTSLPSGRLIVREDDNPEHRFVLVVGQDPRFSIKGWLHGFAARDRGEFKAEAGRPAAWFVYWKDLNPDLSWLREEIDG